LFLIGKLPQDPTPEDNKAKELRIMRPTWFISIVLLGISLASAQQAPPVLFFSDLTSGPNSGGESVNGFSGAYVTLYGNFFGTSQGTSTLTWNGLNCLRVVSWGTTWRWYQKIVVQLGPSCSAGSGNFVVTVGGAASNGIPFTVNSGHIFFVSTSGNDSSSGSFASPWRTIPHAVQSAGPSAGNIIYAENGVQATADDGQSWNAALTLRAEWCQGTAAAPDALIAYPGATVQIGNSSGTTPVGGLVSTDFTASNGSCMGNWTFAEINFRGIGPVNVNGGGTGSNPAANPSTNWRFVANDVSNPSATGGGGGAASFETAWSSGKILGNYMHDLNLASTDRLEQGLYLSSDSNNWEVGWNELYNGKGRTLFQIHSSPVCVPSCGSGDKTGLILHGLTIHDNIIHGSAEEGLIVDTVDPSQGAVVVYNNVFYANGNDGNSDGTVYQADSSDYNTNNGVGSSPPPVEFYNNTIYCVGAGACWSSYWEVHNGQSIIDRVRNNLLYSTGSSYQYWDPGVTNWSLQGGSSQCDPSSATTSNCPNFQGSNNLVYGNGAATFTSILTSNVNSNPLLVSPGSDFHLQSGSPATGAGVPISGLTYDIDGRVRPNPPSIGAYEFGSASASTPVPPTGLTATVH
jgi:hypothetical protein